MKKGKKLEDLHKTAFFEVAKLFEQVAKLFEKVAKLFEKGQTARGPAQNDYF